MRKANQPIGVNDISPGFSDDYARYLELNPAYDTNPDTGRFNHPAAAADVHGIFFADSGVEHPRSNQSIERQIKIFHIYIRALIPQLDGNELWEEYRGTDGRFSASPRTMGKTVQETSTHPTMRMALPREIGNDPEAISKIPLHPRYLNDTRLTNLGLAKYVEAEGRGQEARAALRAAAVDDVREMMLSLEPITRPDEGEDTARLKYFRMMRIGAGANTGYLLGTQHIRNKKTLFKTDLYNAGLRLKEIDASHEREIGLLKAIQTLLESISADLDAWKSLEPQQREEVAATIGECIEMLENVVDDHKVRMRELVENAITLKDRTGRYNPQAKKAQVDTAINYLGRRLKAIEDIWQHLGTDTKKVEQIRQTNLQPLAKFLADVQKLHTQFALLRPAEPLAPEKRAKIIENLQALRAEAEKMNFEPLLSYGEKFTCHIDATIKALEAGNQPEAAREFMRMIVVTKIVRSMDRLKQVYERLALSPETIDPQVLKSELIRQHHNLKTKAIGEEFVTDEYNEIYGQLYHLYNYCIQMCKVLTGELPKRTPEKSPQPDPSGESLPSKPAPAEAHASPPPKNTLSRMLAVIKSKVPTLSGFLDRIQHRVTEFIASHRPDARPSSMPPAPAAFTEEDRLRYYGKIQRRIKNFNYAALIRSIDSKTA